MIRQNKLRLSDEADRVVKDTKRQTRCRYSAGIQRVLSTYTWDKTAAAYLSIIKRQFGTVHAPEEGGPTELDARERILHYLS